MATTPAPTVSAAARVKRWLKALQREDPAAYAQATDTHTGVVVGLSGGADSLALTIGAVRAGLTVHAVVVDHQLQEGSAQVAQRAAEQAMHIGAATSRVMTVQVQGTAEGPAREARYEALGRAAQGRGVLVAHTATDDAEGFLVALSRGSGTDALAGMRPLARRHPVVVSGAAWIGRPLLDAIRSDTEAECTLAGLEYWNDPHNYSQDYVRSRVRQELLPAMESILGTRVRENLSRSARLLRDDAQTLDDAAQKILQACAKDGGSGGLVASLQIRELEQHTAALRRRVYKHWLDNVAGSLTNAHIQAIDSLVANWRGQGPVSVPWPVDSPTMNTDRRTSHRLVVRRKDQHLQLDDQQRHPDSEGR